MPIVAVLLLLGSLVCSKGASLAKKRGDVVNARLWSSIAIPMWAFAFGLCLPIFGMQQIVLDIFAAPVCFILGAIANGILGGNYWIG